MSTKLSKIKNALQRLDSWYSATTGQGTSTYDKLRGITYKRAQKLDDDVLEALYVGNDLAAKIVDRKVDDALRQGVKIWWRDSETENTTEFVDWAESKFDVLSAVTQASKWRRLFGGAAVLIGYQDSGKLDSPVKPGTGKILFLRPIERRELTAYAYYDDPADPKWGMPAIYRYHPRTQFVHGSQLIHESRLVIFQGLTSTNQELIRNHGWGHSVLQRVYDVLRGFDASWHSVLTLLQDSSHGIYKIKGLMDLLASDNIDTLLTRLQEIDRSKSAYRPILLDADGEDYGRLPSALTDYHNILSLAMQRIASAANMPVTILFGQAPAGLNATGESDTRNWYDFVRQEQAQNLAKPLAEIYWHLAAQPDSPTKSRDLENVAVDFPSLWQMSPQEEAALYQLTSVADKTYIDAGVYLPEEVAIARSQSDTPWGAIEIDTEQRQKQLEADLAAALEAAENPPEPPPLPPVPPPDGEQPPDQSAAENLEDPDTEQAA